MKLIQISVHFEYTEIIDELLDRHQATDYVRYPMVDGRDCDGKHFGTQVFPGNCTVFHAQVDEKHVDALFEDLRGFQKKKPSHRHIQAILLPIERRL